MPRGVHPNSIANLTPGRRGKATLTALEREAKRVIAKVHGIKLNSARDVLESMDVDPIRELILLSRKVDITDQLRFDCMKAILPYAYATQRPVDRDGNAATPLLFIMPGAQAPATTVIDITPEELDGNEPETED